MEIQGKSILIKPDNNPKQTSKGIIIPSTIKRMESKGTVLECGSGCVVVKKGDRVIYSAKNGSIIPIGEEEHHYIIEDYIQYVYGEGES